MDVNSKKDHHQVWNHKSIENELKGCSMFDREIEIKQVVIKHIISNEW